MVNILDTNGKTDAQSQLSLLRVDPLFTMIGVKLTDWCIT